MHHIYHTHGFVLRSRPTGEANKVLVLYTRELGLVRAVVQGIRLSKSKLRFALQDYSYAHIDLVRGREVWRVTSATTVGSFPLVRTNSESFELMVRVSTLIERLCDGEEAHEKIFDEYIQALTLLDVEMVDPSVREGLELHLVLRLMNTLGYIGDSSSLATYLADDFNPDTTEHILKERTSIVAHINRALRESQL